MCVQFHVADDVVDPVVEAIVVAAYTGEPGDGKLVLTPVSEVLDIHDAGRCVDRRLLQRV